MSEVNWTRHASILRLETVPDAKVVDVFTLESVQLDAAKLCEREELVQRLLRATEPIHEVDDDRSMADWAREVLEVAKLVREFGP